MTRSLDPRALGFWLATATFFLIRTDNPWVWILSTAACLAVLPLAPERRLFKVMLLVGVSAAVLRTALFALTGHDGQALFSVPSIELGGLSIGGPVVWESLSAGVKEGLKLVAILATFGLFLSLVETYQLLRSMPRSLFEVGLMLNIALSFGPQLLKTMGNVADAQRMRGGKRGSLRLSWFVPVIATAMEKSVTLAEVMDSRGFGRTSAAPHHWRWGLLAGSLAMTVAWPLAIFGTGGTLAVLAGTIATAIVLVSLYKLGRSSARSRYKTIAPDLFDGMVALSAAVLFVISFSPGLAVAATPLIAAPALLALRRAA